MNSASLYRRGMCFFNVVDMRVKCHKNAGIHDMKGAKKLKIQPKNREQQRIGATMMKSNGKQSNDKP